MTGLFQPIGEQGGAALCGSVFKVEYTDCGQRRVYPVSYTHLDVYKRQAMEAAEKGEDMYGPFDSVADLMEALNACLLYTSRGV